MKKRNIQRKIQSIENHETAAWINIDNLKFESRVFKPEYIGVDQAKEYVDENEK